MLDALHIHLNFFFFMYAVMALCTSLDISGKQHSNLMFRQETIIFHLGQSGRQTQTRKRRQNKTKQVFSAQMV